MSGTTTISMSVIARIHSDFPDKFGIPRQAGLAESLRSEIVFEEEFRSPDALKGLENFSHIWILWQFSKAVRECFSPTVRPPMLGGNTRMGVFATRSPYRPNAIGLSCVRLEEIRQDEKNGDVLVVSGADLMDGTPILDIKPYLAYTDSHPEAASGFADPENWETLHVDFPEELLLKIPENSRAGLLEVLRQDPRPAYQRGEEREYGLSFAGKNIRFRVKGDTLHVLAVEELR